MAGTGRELRLSLTVQPDELGLIRRDMVKRLEDWGFAPVSEIAVLVVVELLTNVYKHAGGQCDLLVVPVEPHLLITVSDRLIDVPTKRPYSRTAEEGRGLILINELTEHWETVLTASGKDVRCVIRMPAAHTGEGRS
ncbi:ATP-binding protein [Streptomyces sp. NPDC088725]|uniref:ATP-binding protein n=1 Tax=Streptomyces sp. NPDC088725 TaxID=3365873 RepID=UPI003809CDEF